MFSVNLHEFKPIQALDCINLNMTIHKYELLPGLIGADLKDWEEDNIPYTMRKKRQAFFNGSTSQKPVNLSFRT